MTARPAVDGDRYVATCPTHETKVRPLGDLYTCSKCGPGPLLGWDVTDRTTGRVVDHIEAPAKPVVATAPVGDEKIRSAAAAGKPQPNSHRVLAAAKFMDAAGAVLFVKLFYRAWAVPFAVEWESRPKGGKKAAGRCAQTIDEAEAQRHYLAAIRDAIGAGWTRVNKRSGSGRGMAMLPIPAPPSAAAARPRKAKEAA